MQRYGVLYARRERDPGGPRSVLSDDKGRHILFRIDEDPTRSFAILQDVVTHAFLGWDGEESKLILHDKAVTTRNLL